LRARKGRGLNSCSACLVVVNKCPDTKNRRCYAENIVSEEGLLLHLTKDDAIDTFPGDEIGKASSKVAERIWKATLGH
jgi:hypothetical protein